MNSPRKHYPVLSVTDNTAQWQLRWLDHLNTLPPPDHPLFNPHAHLANLHDSLSNQPPPHPAHSCLRLGLAGIGVMLLILLWHLL